MYRLGVLLISQLLKSSLTGQVLWVFHRAVQEASAMAYVGSRFIRENSQLVINYIVKACCCFRCHCGEMYGPHAICSTPACAS